MKKRLIFILLFFTIFNIYSNDKDDLIWQGKAKQADLGILPNVGYFIASKQLPQGALVLVENVENNATTKAITINLSLTDLKNTAVLSDMVATTLNINDEEIHNINVYLLLTTDQNYKVKETEEVEVAIDSSSELQEDLATIENIVEIEENAEDLTSKETDKIEVIQESEDFSDEKLNIEEDDASFIIENLKLLEETITELEEKERIIIPKIKERQVPIIEISPLQTKPPKKKERKEKKEDEAPKIIERTIPKVVEEIIEDVVVDIVEENKVEKVEEEIIEKEIEDYVIDILELEHSLKNYDDLNLSEFFTPAIDEGEIVTSETSPLINFLVSVNGKEMLLPRIPDRYETDYYYEIIESLANDKAIDNLFLSELDQISDAEKQDYLFEVVEGNPKEFEQDLYLSLEDFPGLKETDDSFSLITSRVNDSEIDLPLIEDYPFEKAMEKASLIESYIVQAEKDFEMLGIEKDTPQIAEREKLDIIEKPYLSELDESELEIAEIEFRERLLPEKDKLDIVEKAWLSELEESDLELAEIEFRKRKILELNKKETAQEEIAEKQSPEKQVETKPFDFDKFRGKETFFLQIGSYSDLALANNVVKSLEATEYPVGILEESASKDFKVLIGPIFEGEKGLVLKTIRSLGFKDSFFKKLQ